MTGRKCCCFSSATLTFLLLGVSLSLGQVMLDVCPERGEVLEDLKGQTCLKTCVSDRDCPKRRKCLCDGACGLSCVSPSRSCPWPLEEENADVLPIKGSQSFDAVVKIICKPGFKMANGQEEVFSRCQGDRKWSELPTACESVPEPPVFCTPPNDIEHGFYSGSDFKAGDTVQYTCSSGFRLEGTDINYCQEDGTWKYPEPTCNRMPSSPRLLWIFSASGLFVESQIAGVDLPSLKPQMEILEFEVFCKPPKEISNGYLVAIQKPKYETFEVIYYLCKKGFFLDGVNKVTCLVNGSWSNIPACRARCKVPVERSRVLYKGKKLWVTEIHEGLVRHGELVSFYCRSENQTCSYLEPSECYDGVLSAPACYKEPTWVQYNLFPKRLVSEIAPC